MSPQGAPPENLQNVRYLTKKGVSKFAEKYLPNQQFDNPDMKKTSEK